MFHRFHDRFGTAGLVIAVIALIAALGGTALAAGGLTSTQKKEVTKIAKKYAGKPGPAGAPGTNGTNGAPGEKGAAGANGESVKLAAAGSCPEGGTKVTVGGESKEVCNGVKGINGKSIVTGTLNPGQGTPPCVEGGVTVEVEGSGTKKQICNGGEGPAGPTGPAGATGPTGPEGVCSTSACHLPTGVTETGVYSAAAMPVSYGGKVVMTPISFNIPLAAKLGETEVHVLSEIQVFALSHHEFGAAHEEFCEGLSGPELTTCEQQAALVATECPGSVAAPTAASGSLCLYEHSFQKNLASITIVDVEASEVGAGKTGANLILHPTTSTVEIGVNGVWAVTG